MVLAWNHSFRGGDGDGRVRVQGQTSQSKKNKMRIEGRLLYLKTGKSEFSRDVLVKWSVRDERERTTGRVYQLCSS